jgi:hypothetical protein
MNNNDIKSARYCFTIHNYTKEELKSFHQFAQSLEKHRFIAYGLEIAPDTGTPHIQGYIELNSAQRFTFLHNYFNIKRNKKKLKFHVEIANGTAEQNKKYSSKDGNYFEFGEPATQGSRTDLKEIKRLLKENPNNLIPIIEEHGNNYQQIRFAETLQPYFMEDRDPDKSPTVIWIFGSTGIGKTSMVYRTFGKDNVCSVSAYKWLGTGYRQQECLLMDDFRDDDLPFNALLKITDRFPFTLERKGGQIPLNSPFIIITSPRAIRYTYASIGEKVEQLLRRVKEINLDLIIDDSAIDLRNLDEKYIYRYVNYRKEDF